jgi:hypothetical protein
MLQHEFPGSRGGMATGGGWFALTAGTKPCQRCGYGPAIACLPGALYECICATCARLGGCSEEIIAKGVSAHGSDTPLSCSPTERRQEHVLGRTDCARCRAGFCSEASPARAPYSDATTKERWNVDGSGVVIESDPSKNSYRGPAHGPSRGTFVA